MSTEAMKLQEIMTQAQVFASAWSLVGGRFDGGNAMDEAEVAKNELYQMVAEALAQPQQELEYCTDYHCAGDCGQPHNQEEMREFLASQPQPEPVAFITPLMEQQLFDDWCPYKGNPDPRVVWAAAVDAVNGLLLGASLPARKPLTDAQINAFFEGMEPNNGFWLSFARAIEVAHGIKGDA